MNKGFVVFSPISHSHVIADNLDENLRTDQQFWMKQDLPILMRCDILVIVSIGKNGEQLIKDSKGCQDEITAAQYKDLTILTYQYNE